MTFFHKPFSQALAIMLAGAALFTLTCRTKSSAQTTPVTLQFNVSIPFRFIAYGDARFHDVKDLDAANPPVRRALVQAIANANPFFVCFTGDIVYNGYDTDDWKVWDTETSVWRDKKIPILPALGNHDLHGNENVALRNYFQRFPDLKNNRYYSARAGNALILVLDSALDELSGPQGQWLNSQLDSIPTDVDFVFIMLHHPPYTSSSDLMIFGKGGGHSARKPELRLAKMLEERQSHSRARFIVFSGHVHNYERHEAGGVTYFVTGGGGAHPYLVPRAPMDPFQSKEINYHYLLVEVDHQQVTITMNRLQLSGIKEIWTQPDTVKIGAPDAAAPKSGGK
ncbi:MAG TPA: metallophosphoesterase [Candidatus Sulfotelmatobacter sp.]